ncbi:hypothetical protein [Aquimarina pacifica]|uniref:hypothetical protein n=1 Tax=Aquimarina pacifica TaxID=1296415 RepID=UPI00046E53AD|nr:hypothetical protein [Aquimarina pacifica]
MKYWKSNQSTKIESNYPQIDDKKGINIEALKIKKTFNLFFIEKFGFLLILISGLMPFLHAFVKDEILENRFFGFTSYQTFLYSLGGHLCTFLLVIGILFTISTVSNLERFKVIQKYLQYTLLSPFVSGFFYLTWVFIPDVDYNYLAYTFVALFILGISFIIFRQIIKYINTLILINQHKETVIESGMSYLKSKLKKK